MEGLICTACRIPLLSQQICKAHYKSPFHTYNLKRKILQLAPVSYQAFLQKQSQSGSFSESSKSEPHCTCCGRNFPSQKAYQKHIKTKQQRSQKASNSHLQSDPLKTCLFCNRIQQTIDQNLVHMFYSHGFFIPNVQSIRDLGELLGYLNQKVRVGFTCLYCNTQKSRSLQAVQQHMADKQHCFMNVEEDQEEFEDFYDWGTDNSFTVMSESSGDFVDIESSRSETSFTQITESNGFRVGVQSSGELRLENGKMLGHKQYARYYKQYFRRHPEHENIRAIVQEHYSSNPRQEKRSWVDRRGIITQFKEQQRKLLDSGSKTTEITTKRNPKSN